MEQLKVQVKDIIANAIGLELDEFDNDTHLYNDLGADSVVGFEIIAKLQKKFQVVIPAEKVVELTSVDKITNFISNSK